MKDFLSWWKKYLLMGLHIYAAWFIVGVVIAISVSIIGAIIQAITGAYVPAIRY